MNLITRRSLIMPHLKYPPGIITAWERSKDITHTALIQHSLNEALKQRAGEAVGEEGVSDGDVMTGRDDEQKIFQETLPSSLC